MTIEELQSKRVLVLGFGLNNQALVRFLAERGISLTVRERDAALKEGFAAEFPALTERVRFEGGDRLYEGLTEYGVVFRSPSLPFLHPAFQQAIRRGVILYSQTKLFFDLCPAQIIGVTGTKGKGTTCSLIYHVLSKGYKKGKTYLAGNIGLDPFSFFEELTADDLVILELSSFQLQDLQKSPHIGVMLEIGSDHLDHHKDMAEYWNAKSNLISHQGMQDVAIVNVGNPSMEQQASLSSGTVYRYSRFHPRRQSAWVDATEGEVVFFQVGQEIDSFSISGRKLLGEHNLDNILPAVIVGALFHVDRGIMREAVCSFEGLPHRLSHVGTFSGVGFYDDSIATTPESAIVSVKAFPDHTVHLLAGGTDKGGDYRSMARYVLEHCRSVSLLPGDATKKLQAALKKAAKEHKGGGCLVLGQATDPLMPTVLSGIHPHLSEGDVVLLAPGASSFASFSSYKERGDKFAQAVKERYAT